MALQGWIPAVRCFAVGGNHMALIRELREASGAPISDVKAALQQADWDMGESWVWSGCRERPAPQYRNADPWHK